MLAIFGHRGRRRGHLYLAERRYFYEMRSAGRVFPRTGCVSSSVGRSVIFPWAGFHALLPGISLIGLQKRAHIFHIIRSALMNSNSPVAMQLADIPRPKVCAPPPCTHVRAPRPTPLPLCRCTAAAWWRAARTRPKPEVGATATSSPSVDTASSALTRAAACRSCRPTRAQST
jgi:hypothetical protein